MNFLNVVENPHVRVLQVTLQPGAVRRPHVHNDVTFHMLVPINGSLELTVEKDPVVTTVPGQAYYMVKGQTHSFTNKSAAAVQVIELFITYPGLSRPLYATAPAAAPRHPQHHPRSNEKEEVKRSCFSLTSYAYYFASVPSSDSSPPSRALPATPPT